MKRILSWFKAHYDKLIAFVVLIGLLVSLLYLATAVGRIKEKQAQDDREMKGEKIVYPDALKLDTKPFEDGKKGIEQPVQLAEWTNALFIPEERAWCPDCKAPIPINAEKCPFCEYVIPKEEAEDPNRDIDKDGIKNGWEIEHGLNQNDPSDAAMDNDRDGFSNLEEYLGGTDPNEPNSYPPVERKLWVTKIKADAFQLRFMGKMTGSDGVLKFQINLRKGEKTYFAKLNEEVGNPSFKLVAFEPKMVEEDVPGIGKKLVDRSILTLQRGEKKIPLILGKEEAYTEQAADLIFTLDKTSYKGLKSDSEIELKGKKYRVISIDSKQGTVVIERLLDNERFTISKALEGAETPPRTSDVNRPGEGDKPR